MKTELTVSGMSCSRGYCRSISVIVGWLLRIQWRRDSRVTAISFSNCSEFCTVGLCSRSSLAASFTSSVISSEMLYRN